MTFVEVSVALVVAGLMSWAAFSGYETVSAQQEIERGRAEAQQLQSVVRAFALRHGRLPCPAANTDGYESLTAGVCTTGNQVGWFPYVSVGLELPTDRLRARYSVLRAAHATAAQDADLAVARERTGDAAGDATFLDVTDLIAALNNAATLAVCCDANPSDGRCRRGRGDGLCRQPGDGGRLLGGRSAPGQRQRRQPARCAPRPDKSLRCQPLRTASTGVR